MSLAPREQETLTAIETALRTKDPRLEAMFRVFGDRDPRSKRQRRLAIALWVARRGPANVIIILVTVVTLLATCAAAAVILA